MKPLRNPAQERTLRRKNTVSGQKKFSPSCLLPNNKTDGERNERATSELPMEQKESDAEEEERASAILRNPARTETRIGKKVSSGECNTPEPDLAESINGKR